MKARITFLNAPWPEGASVGDVVAFEAGAVPAWAVGKCLPEAEDREAQHLVSAPAVEPKPADSMEALRAEAQAFIDRLRAEHDAQLADLQAQLSAALAAKGDLQLKLSDAQDATAAAQAQLADLQAQLDSALAAKPGKTKG